MTRRIHLYHRHTVPFLLVALFCAHGVLAQSEEVPKGGTDDAKKEQSEFKRDPFWPVGFVPERIKEAMAKKESPDSVKPTIANDWNMAMKKLVINGVSSRASNEFYAVINGQVKSVGDSVSVTYGGKTYTWAVDGIKPPGSVKLRRVSAR